MTSKILKDQEHEKTDLLHIYTQYVQYKSSTAYVYFRVKDLTHHSNLALTACFAEVLTCQKGVEKGFVVMNL